MTLISLNKRENVTLISFNTRECDTNFFQHKRMHDTNSFKHKYWMRRNIKMIRELVKGNILKQVAQKHLDSTYLYVSHPSMSEDTES